jgi:hypothetical protein
VSDYTEARFFPGVVVKRRGDREARVIDAVCIVVAGALLTLTVVGWVGLVRVLLAFAFAVYVPGWAMVTNFMPKTRASRAALPVLTSLTILTAAATFTLWLHAWHPMQLFDIEAGASIAMMSVGAIRRERRPLHDQRLHHDAVPGSRQTSIGRAVGHGSRFAASDALLPISIILWIVGVRRIHPSPVPLSVLPAGSVVVFLAGLGVLVLSTGLLLARRIFSSPRMALHLGVLIVMLYGTAPIVYREPRFAWVFKHTAFTNYIAVYHVLGRSLDIYRIWPGFFALTAWIDKVAGVGTPLVYASWAELFFGILYVLELAWILRALRLDERERWLALFLFAGANWIAQDYFSPQGFALVLSLGLFGIALHWLKGEERPWVTKLEHRADDLLGRVRTGLFGRWMLPRTTSSRREHPRATVDQGKTALEYPAKPPHWFAVVALLFTYGVLTFVHELSPYVVAAQFCALVIIGLIRPWWLVLAMLAIAVGFLAPNFTYVNDNYGLTASIGNFFGNVQGPSSLLVKLGPEALLSARAAHVLSAGMWGLAVAGIVRRLHQGRNAVGLAVVAFSPVALLVLLAYGNEGVLRVYLFSLPWIACLAASALSPAPGTLWRRRAIPRTVVLAVVIALFSVAFFGDDGVWVMTPADVQASEFVYAHARPGPLMTLTDNFPAPIGADFYKFPLVNPLLGSGYPGVKQLNPADVSLLTTEIVSSGGGVTAPGYFAVSPSMIAYAEEYGLATAAQCRTFLAAMDRAPGWRILYSRAGATIYELALGP